MHLHIMAGLPVIVSDVPEQRLLVEREKIGMVLDKYTAEDLQKAVMQTNNLDMISIKKCERALKQTLFWQVQENVFVRRLRESLQELGV